MKKLLIIASVLVSAMCVGCAVRDGHEDEPAPIWWPTFLYRATTHPTDDEYNQTNAQQRQLVPANESPAAAQAVG
jgi:hypothetical protein